MCLALLVINLVKVKKNPQPIEGVDFFPADAAKTIKEAREEKAKKKESKAEEKKTERDKENG